MIDSVWLKARADDVRRVDAIDPALYQKYNVKRGLRNGDGTGVLVGLTTIGNVHGYVVSEGEKQAVPGQLFYRGVDVVDLVRACEREKRFGFEECAYLLLFGELPTAAQLAEWQELLAEHRRLPDGFKEKAIVHAPGMDLMNSIARAVLTAYTYDTAVELIAGFPTIAAYAYQAKAHYHLGRALMMRYPDPTHGTAENFLTLIREDGRYTPLEAETLDLALILHAEHGGGNNSSFVTHVVTSSFSDMYSTVAAATLSLKGSRHGGANLRTMRQMAEMKRNIRSWTTSRRSCAARRATAPASSTDSATPSTRSPTRAPSFSRRRRRCSPRRTGAWTSSRSTTRSRRLAPASSSRSIRARATCARTWTSTAGSCTTCSASRRTSIRRSSPWGASSAGARTAWRSS